MNEVKVFLIVSNLFVWKIGVYLSKTSMMSMKLSLWQGNGQLNWIISLIKRRKKFPGDWNGFTTTNSGSLLFRNIVVFPRVHAGTGKFGCRCCINASPESTQIWRMGTVII